MVIVIWIGMAFCLFQSAMFSGLNLACFSISKLQLEVESKSGNRHALRVFRLREDANFLLTTVLWGNIGINVLLTLLSNSVMAGIAAFLFSTFAITFFGEIIPQAYFSRHALRTASAFSPVVRIYQIVLFPVAKPTAILLDKWLGTEAIRFFQERDLRELLRIHVDAPETEIETVEGKGAINFLSIDDLSIVEEEESIDPRSIVQLHFEQGRPIFPPFARDSEDPFLRRINESGGKWVLLTDDAGEPQLTLDSDAFLRAILFDRDASHPLRFCHRPIIITNPKTSLGEMMSQLQVYPTHLDDDVIDDDIVVYWGHEKRVITGSDLFGRLMRGIAKRDKISRELP